MSTPTPARTWVDPPPVDPYLYGLLSVADVTTGGGTWQVGGVEYDSDACALGGYVTGSCPTPLPEADQTAAVTATPDATANTVVVGAAADADFTVSWALVSPTGGVGARGTLAPDEEETVTVAAGDYTLQVQAFGYPITSGATAVTVPGGDPVTATATITATGPGTSHDKPVAEGLNHVDSPGPFTIYARAECNAVGFNDPLELARDRVAMIENREVERYFSRFVLGAVGIRLPLGVAGVGIKQALGALEADAALFYGGAPVLHAPRWTNPYFEDRNLLQPNRDTQPVRRTHLASKTAFGAYFDNPFDPATPPADGTFWLVATGYVRAWRSEVFANDSFTTATNLRAAIAERTYLLDADCYRAAVLVDLTGEG